MKRNRLIFWCSSHVWFVHLFVHLWNLSWLYFCNFQNSRLPPYLGIAGAIAYICSRQILQGPLHPTNTSPNQLIHGQNMCKTMKVPTIFRKNPQKKRHPTGVIQNTLYSKPSFSLSKGWIWGDTIRRLAKDLVSKQIADDDHHHRILWVSAGYAGCLATNTHLQRTQGESRKFKASVCFHLCFGCKHFAGEID